MSAERPSREPDLAREALRALRRARRPDQPRDPPRGSGRGRSDYSGAGPDTRDPQPLGRLVDRLVADRGWERTTTQTTVLACWDRLVGADVAGHCTPQSLRDGELVLAAESTAWATQLRLLAPDLVRTLARELGDGVVRRVRVQGPTGPSWRRGPRSVAGRGPRDTYG